MIVPPITQGPVPTFASLPEDDPLGTVRRVGSNGKLYQRMIEAIIPEAAWFEFGTIPEYLPDRSGI